VKAPDEYLAMYEAHERGDADAVRNLLEAHPELEEMGPDDDMVTWLHVAAEKGQIGVAEYWLGRGYDVNRNLRRVSQEMDGLMTPLHMAKDAATTRYFLSRGASVNACARYAGTPLHCAIVSTGPSTRRR
jgi:ankyrin repeat protein